MNELTFKSHTLTPIVINNLPYLETRQIGVALGYTRGDVVGQLYKAHADEFTPDMTCTSELLVQGQKRKVRVFSLRGCHLLAMFSKTPVAKEFRRWILDLIEQHNAVVREIRTTPVNMRAIGGMVKRCVNKALVEFLESAPNENAEPWEVTDTQILNYLYNWHATRNKIDIVKMRELVQENDELKRRLAAIKQAII